MYMYVHALIYMYKYIVHHVCSLNPEGDEAAVQAVYESIQVCTVHVHVHSCIACTYKMYTRDCTCK